MDAAGHETQAMFTLAFGPSSPDINGDSFPDTNDDITLGADAPAGTTLAVNATAARSGRITVLLNFNGPIPSGVNKRIVNLRFRAANAIAAGAVKIAGRQIVNGSGQTLDMRSEGSVTMSGVR